ncbi:MAG: N-acetyl-alpha-D-glucosaminyl L-malate synthase [candidate division WS2 bacterium]|nr:N-acetyl-alpha-D-glucosaminyl L-malate synthase [Candidatus Lithacetigena glycinireducens]
MEKIRVAHLIGGGDVGGAKQHLLTLLSHLNSNKFIPSIIALGDGILVKEAKDLNIKTHVMPYKGVLWWKVLKPLKEIIRQEKPDILHTHGVRANFYGRVSCLGERKTRVITTVHSIPFYDYSNPLWGVAATLVDTATSKMVDSFVAVSKAVLNHLLKRGVPLSKIEVIYNAIDETDLTSTSEKTVSIPVIGTVGRLVKVKGHVYLVEAIPAVMKKYGPVEVRFIGDGPSKEYLVSVARKLNIQEQVVFTGRVKDVYKEISQFTIGVFPSLMEGMGLAVIETMAMGIPIIASRVGGIEEVVAHEKTGLLVERKNPAVLADSIINLLENESFRQRLGQEGRKQVLLRFNLNHMLERTEWLYIKTKEGVMGNE